ncbi:hypothetical protein GCK72_005212 [Caenorhabditis remanei]|uniref:Uncharacterized protein n=1 Tax=Caenorhabditis remanei TaxID=31234 RepID=A0A6A5HC22_CAERE|nr:hypothetical protein GCK72_005212 [Caenorhabditis remanei]KAF1765260.1 hypothetical protein GCK72_005212 [Caenorhabditis remanei]
MMSTRPSLSKTGSNARSTVAAVLNIECLHVICNWAELKKVMKPFLATKDTRRIKVKHWENLLEYSGYKAFDELIFAINRKVIELSLLSPATELVAVFGGYQHQESTSPEVYASDIPFLIGVEHTNSLFGDESFGTTTAALVTVEYVGEPAAIDDDDVALGGVHGVVGDVVEDVTAEVAWFNDVFSQVGHKFSMDSPIESWRCPWANWN